MSGRRNWIMNGRKGKMKVREKSAENCIKNRAQHETTQFIQQFMNMWYTTHYHSEGYSVNFEHFSADVNVTTSTKAATSVSILRTASPPAAHELLDMLELHNVQYCAVLLHVHVGVAIIRALRTTYTLRIRIKYTTCLLHDLWKCSHRHNDSANEVLIAFED